MSEVGAADAFGHRHKANVGEALADEIRQRTGIETVASELTYDLRSGEPDSLDSMVAMTFANVAMDLIADGTTGRMVGDPRRPVRPRAAAGSDAAEAARSTWPRCTTSSGSGRGTTAGSGSRCCSWARRRSVAAGLGCGAKWARRRRSRGAAERRGGLDGPDRLLRHRGLGRSRLAIGHQSARPPPAQLSSAESARIVRATADTSSSPWPWATSAVSNCSHSAATGSAAPSPARARGRSRGPCDGARP